MEEEINGNNFNLKSIQIIYSMEFARKINQRIIDLCRTLSWLIELKADKKTKSNKTLMLLKDRKDYKQSKDELIEFLEIMGDLRNKFLFEDNFRKSLSCELCIIEFETEEDKDLMLKYFGQ